MKLFYPALAILGAVLLVFAILMTVPPLAMPNEPNHHAFVMAASITFAIGVVLALGFRKSFDRLLPRQVFLVTVSCWLGSSFFGALPFFLGTPVATLSDAVFESVSGVTTTGSTVLAGLDSLPRDILLWRSLLQWVGGIGIIGMAVAVLPFLRVGGMRLFKTESSEMSEKAIPRIRSLVTSLVAAYVTLSMLCAMAYWLAGMTFFEAVNHAMTTLSTGGYSTSDGSLGHFHSATIHWVATIFMAMGGIPFVLYVRYWSTLNSSVFNDRQVKAFLILLLGASALLASDLMIQRQMHFFDAVTLSVFNVTSIITTTGYSTTDYTTWGAAAIVAFFFLTFIGGCSGSTAGGLKIFRFQLSLMLLREQIRKLVHPSAVAGRTYDNLRVTDDIIASAIAFSFTFFTAMGVIAVILGLMGLDLTTSLSGAATALANVGPGLGEVIGPAGNFQTLPDAAKWVLCAGMILGRLELLVIIVIFTRDFWRG